MSDERDERDLQEPNQPSDSDSRESGAPEGSKLPSRGTENPAEVLEGLLEENPEEASKLLGIALGMEQYRSPHPHPDHLERYAKLYPEAPKIIFDSFDKQGAHRREMEDRYLKGSERRANIGQWLAFSLVLAVILAGVFAMSQGEATAASIIITGALAGGVLLVIAGVRPETKKAVRQSQQNHRESARAEVAEADQRALGPSDRD